MSIRGAGLSIIRLLEREYGVLRGQNHGLTFKLFTTSDFDNSTTDHVSLFLYRVEVDPTRRHDVVSGSSAFLSPPVEDRYLRISLAVDLHLILTVWSRRAEKELQILGDCMAILDDNAVMSADQLQTLNVKWYDNTSLKISLDPLTHEDMLRLWDSLEAHYHLSVPYVVRTVRLRPAKRVVEEGTVVSRTNIYTPRVP